MQALRYVALPCAILILSTTALFASDAELTSSEIRTRMIGNTVVGIEDGKYYEEYLQPNGRIAGRNRKEVYNGWWRIDGNRLCFAYDEDNDDDTTPSKTWDCSPVGLSGDRITWKDDGDQARLVPGRLLSSLRTPPPRPDVQALRKPD